MVIAIDGPGGAGKTTIARALARELGFTYIDTGAMYRAITLKALRRGLDLTDEEAIARLTQHTRISLEEGKVLMDGEDVSEEIRKRVVSCNVSIVARNKGVRRHLVRIQRRLASKLRGVVVEGRDIASVVFPNAEWKFYLDATIDVRAKRRWNELVKRGEEVDLCIIKHEIQERDSQDMERKEGPLKLDKDAIYIDTTSMGIEEVILRIKEIILKREVKMNPFKGVGGISDS